MPSPEQLKSAFWKAVKADMTMMVGLEGKEHGHMRPLTAQLLDDAEQGPIWFFTSNESELVNKLAGSDRAVATFASKRHDLFASINGTLQMFNDRDIIDQLWNPYVAAWYEGKDDPKLALLRFDAEQAEIWENASSLVAGLKILLGVDPKKDYRDKVAEVSLK